MGVDAAGQHQQPAGVDLAPAAGRLSPEGDDAAVADADVAAPVLGLRHQVCVANDEIHDLQTSRNRRPQPCTRRVSTPASLSDFHTTVAMLS